MTLRVYVSGAHSTGKTTLARHLAQELGLPLINEVARQVMAEMELTFETLRVNLSRVAEYQRAVFTRQVEIERNYPDGFVSDRTFCNLAYAARHSLVLADILREDKIQPYMEHVSQALVFFVRPSPACMADDGMREQVDWDEINRIDGILDFMFELYRVPRIGIAERNMKDRVRTAMTAVRLYERATKTTGASVAPQQKKALL